MAEWKGHQESQIDRDGVSDEQASFEELDQAIDIIIPV